jgi:DNA-binding GntR family transcriptional regulator
VVRKGSRLLHSHNPDLPLIDDRVLKALDTQEPLFGTDLSERFNVTHTHITEALHRLVSANKVIKLGRRGWIKCSISS